MSIAMGTRLHINLYIYKTTSVPILVLLSQNAQIISLSRCTTWSVGLRKDDQTFNMVLTPHVQDTRVDNSKRSVLHNTPTVDVSSASIIPVGGGGQW